mgnify:CR=1 FL=1
MTLSQEPRNEFQPSISFDVSLLVYVKEEMGNQDIYLKFLSTTKKSKRLTTHSTDDSDPKLSPDGTRIIWVSKRDDVKGDIWIMNVDGSNKRALTSRHAFERTPIWHPRGDSIYFTSKLPGSNHEQIEQLHLNHCRSIEKSQCKRTIIAEQGYDPAISPDGRILIYVR